MLSEIPASAWAQYPIVLILMASMFVLLREFKRHLEAQNAANAERDKNDKAFQKEQNLQWQNFLREQRCEEQQRYEDLQTSIRDLLGQVKNLTEIMLNFRGDFDKATAKMDERTRPRSASVSKNSRGREAS